MSEIKRKSIPQRRLSKHNYNPPKLSPTREFLERPNQLRFHIRSISTAIAFFGIMIINTLIAIIVPWIAPKQKRNILYYSSRLLAPVLRLTTGIKLKVENQHYLNASRPCVFIANHQSDMDSYIMAAICQPGMTAVGKKELTKMPIFGQWFKRTCFPLHRQNHDEAIKTMNQVAEAMKRDKLALMIMPEGTRNNFSTPEMLPFKKGAFRTAIDNGMPIVPFVIQVYTECFDTRAKRWPGGTLKVRVLPPIETKNLTVADMDSLMSNTFNDMLENLKEISPVHSKNIKELDADD